MMKNETNKKLLGLLPIRGRITFCLVLFFLLPVISLKGKNLFDYSGSIEIARDSITNRESSKKTKIYIFGNALITNLEENDSLEIIVEKKHQRKKPPPQKKATAKLKKETPKKLAQKVQNNDEKKFEASADSGVSFSGKLSLSFVCVEHGGSGKPLFTKIHKEYLEILHHLQSDIVSNIQLFCSCYDFFVYFHTVRPPPFLIRDRDCSLV